jgi:8-oxo-dGTP pyrophosphatase MutT (NUDIX family)
MNFPVSIKGVLVEAGRVVLLENERDEWELPGGRLEPGEAPETCLVREFAEELGAVVEVAREWMAAREAELLPVPYFHVVFTLPPAIGDIAYHNKTMIYDLLFTASAETMLTIAADPKHLGARIGITSVLHSWGSAMTHHPHVHMKRGITP